MTTIDEDDLHTVVGSVGSTGTEKTRRGFLNKELDLIQRTMPFGSTRDDAQREWRGRMQEYRQDENQRQWKRFWDAPRKII